MNSNCFVLFYYHILMKKLRILCQNYEYHNHCETSVYTLQNTWFDKGLLRQWFAMEYPLRQQQQHKLWKGCQELVSVVSIQYTLKTIPNLVEGIHCNKCTRTHFNRSSPKPSGVLSIVRFIPGSNCRGSSRDSRCRRLLPRRSGPQRRPGSAGTTIAAGTPLAVLKM